MAFLMRLVPNEKAISNDLMCHSADNWTHSKQNNYIVDCRITFCFLTSRRSSLTLRCEIVSEPKINTDGKRCWPRASAAQQEKKPHYYPRNRTCGHTINVIITIETLSRNECRRIFDWEFPIDETKSIDYTALASDVRGNRLICIHHIWNERWPVIAYYVLLLHAVGQAFISPLLSSWEHSNEKPSRQPISIKMQYQCRFRFPSSGSVIAAIKFAMKFFHDDFIEYCWRSFGMMSTRWEDEEEQEENLFALLADCVCVRARFLQFRWEINHWICCEHQIARAHSQTLISCFIWW